MSTIGPGVGAVNAWELAEEDHRATVLLERIERDAATATEARLRLEASERGLTFAQMLHRYIGGEWTP